MEPEWAEAEDSEAWLIFEAWKVGLIEDLPTIITTHTNSVAGR